MSSVTLESGHWVTPSLRLTRQLDEGAMGSLWLADHTRLDTEVVVKFVRESLAANETVKRRLEIEARAAARIRSPHVVRVFDFGFLEGTPYIVMEYLEGQSLRERLDETVTLSLRDTMTLVNHTCRALQEAHRLGIVHRDIKPGNLYLLEDDVQGLFVKVLDFGVAKVPSSNLTVPGSVFGTPCYMSPEQAVPRREVDARTDIYSLGIILYELLTGDVPFGCGDPIQVMLSHVGQAPDPVRTRNPAVPTALARVVDRCLRKKPEERFPSMVALCQALEAAAHIEDDDTVPDIEVEEALAPVEVNKTIFFDPSKMAITVDDLVEELGLAPTEPDAPELPLASFPIDPASFASEERLPTPPGPQPWEPAAQRSWMWSCLLLLPVILAAVYFALG